MSRHGWVNPLPGGQVARCGGPGLCKQCQEELAERFKASCERGEHDLCYADGGACCSCGARQSDGCRCTAGDCGHRSDCAVHNEPTFPNGPCDCDARRRAAPA
jgi:hypothetical protein